MPYFVTVILTYHGVTEEALSVDHQHEHHDVVSHASEDAGSGVANDLSLNTSLIDGGVLWIFQRKQR